MRQWIPVILVIVFLLVCSVFILPRTASDMLGPYVSAVTVSSWTAVALILIFLVYVFRTAGKH